MSSLSRDDERSVTFRAGIVASDDGACYPGVNLQTHSQNIRLLVSPVFVIQTP
jgi:hypothetical protein